MQPGKHKHHPKFFFDLGELQINIYNCVPKSHIQQCETRLSFT